MSANANTNWSANRQQLRRKIENVDLAVLSANYRQQRSNDTTYPFRQNSNFYYYSGIKEPGLVLVMDLKTDQEWLIEPEYSHSDIVFEGKPESVELESISQMTVLDHSEGWKRLTSAVTPGSRIGAIAPAKYSQISQNQSQISLWQKLSNLKPRAELVDISNTVFRQRSIKQPWEVKRIQTAIDITARAFDHVAKNLNRFKSEKDVEKTISSVLYEHDCNHAYEPIVASGKNAITLHYTKNNSILRSGALLLIDAGAEYDNYCADITRIFPVGGRFSDRQRAVYQGVLSLQEFAISLLRPGLPLKDFSRHVDEQTKIEIERLGLNPEKFRQYLPHSISHGLGLDVHDRIAFDKLKPGMVLTVEPGIYIKDEAIGVRIEDDVLITKTDNKILSAAIPKII